MTISYDQIRVGDALPAFETEPISRLTLALYCGASGDHNPIHVDTDFAKAAGVGDVFAHGMLSMAYLGRLLTNWVPQSALREYGVRFVAITQVGAKVRCEGRVTEKFEQDGGMTDEFKTFNAMSIVCVVCYSEAKSRHSIPGT